jgi:hypothetical protein
MIIGRPNTIDGFQPLTPPEFAYLRQPIEQALQQGVPLEQQIGVDFNVVCRLMKTVVAMSEEVQRLSAAAMSAASADADQPSPVASLSEDLTDPVVSVTEEPPLPFLAAGKPIVLSEE